MELTTVFMNISSIHTECVLSVAVGTVCEILVMCVTSADGFLRWLLQIRTLKTEERLCRSKMSLTITFNFHQNKVCVTCVNILTSVVF